MAKQIKPKSKCCKSRKRCRRCPKRFGKRAKP